MWLIILSDQLTIVALVGFYPANKLIVRRLLSRRLAPLALGHHAVLAIVSHGCPPPGDRYLRVTHPSATVWLPQPCDLHVLSMPPAFALSQDQTLRFIMSKPIGVEPTGSDPIGIGQRRTNPASYHRLSSRIIAEPECDLTSVTVTLSEYVTVTPHEHHANRNRVHGQNSIIDRARCPTRSSHSHARHHGAPPTYPFLSICDCQRTVDNKRLQPAICGAFGLSALLSTISAQTENSSRPTSNLGKCLHSSRRSAM